MTIMANIRLSDLRCVKQNLQYTSVQSFGKGRLHHKVIVFYISFALQLLAHHNEGDLRKRSESEDTRRNNWECVPQHLLRLRLRP